MNIYAQIKQALPMAAVAAHYGFEVNRAGDMRCPFHNDERPSLHCYPGTRGWYCFVCGTGGDVVDFVAKLYHIAVRQAAVRLDNDFHLGLTAERPGPVSSAVLQGCRRERAVLEAYRDEYNAKCREARTIRSLPKPPPKSPLWGKYAALLGRLDYLDNCYFPQNHWK